jgi:hypothetical protein
MHVQVPLLVPIRCSIIYLLILGLVSKNKNILLHHRVITSFADGMSAKEVTTRLSVTANRVFLCTAHKGHKTTFEEEQTMNNKFLVKTLVKCFGETKTINMLNQLQKTTVKRKARKYKSQLKLA